MKQVRKKKKKAMHFHVIHNSTCFSITQMPLQNYDEDIKLLYQCKDYS